MIRFKFVATSSLLLVCLPPIPSAVWAADSPRQLTDHEGPDFHAQWSPDGATIAFTSRRTGESKIFIVPASGGEAPPVRTGLSGDHHFAWVAAGTHLVFDAYGPDDGPSGLWLIPVTGGEAKRLVPNSGPAYHPALSPDGEWVVFKSMRSGNPDIWKARLDGGSLTRLTMDPETDHHPQWLPEGESIVFTSERSGNDESRITTAPERDDHARVSPDGQRVVFTSWRGGKPDVWIMPVSGGAAIRVTERGENSWPGFSPDGRRLVWFSTRNGQKDLFVVTLDKSR